MVKMIARGKKMGGVNAQGGKTETPPKKRDGNSRGITQGRKKGGVNWEGSQLIQLRKTQNKGSLQVTSLCKKDLL